MQRLQACIFRIFGYEEGVEIKKLNELGFGTQLCIISVYGIAVVSAVGGLTGIVMNLSVGPVSLGVVGLWSLGFVLGAFYLSAGQSLLRGKLWAWIAGLIGLVLAFSASLNRLVSQFLNRADLWLEAEKGNSHPFAGMLLQAFLVLFLFYVVIQFLLNRKQLVKSPYQ